jgi:hypothetical protein
MPRPPLRAPARRVVNGSHQWSRQCGSRATSQPSPTTTTTTTTWSCHHVTTAYRQPRTTVTWTCRHVKRCHLTTLTNHNHNHNDVVLPPRHNRLPTTSNDNDVVLPPRHNRLQPMTTITNNVALPPQCHVTTAYHQPQKSTAWCCRHVATACHQPQQRCGAATTSQLPTEPRRRRGAAATSQLPTESRGP